MRSKILYKTFFSTACVFALIFFNIYKPESLPSYLRIPMASLIVPLLVFWFQPGLKYLTGIHIGKETTTIEYLTQFGQRREVDIRYSKLSRIEVLKRIFLIRPKGALAFFHKNGNKLEFRISNKELQLQAEDLLQGKLGDYL